MKDFLKNIFFKHQFSATDFLIFITFIKIGDFLKSVGNFSLSVQIVFVITLVFVLKLSDFLTRNIFKE